MIQRKERFPRFARGQHPAVCLTNGDFRIRNRLQGNVAQCHNHLRRDALDFRHQPWTKQRNLFLCRRTIAQPAGCARLGRAVFDDVGDVDLAALKPRQLQKVVKVLSRFPDKRSALQALSDEDERCAW